VPASLSAWYGTQYASWGDAMIGRGKRVLFPTILVALALVTTEGVSHLVIRLSRPLFAEEIRTTRAIFREQSDRIRRLIAPDASRMLSVDSVLGWRYSAGHHDAANTISSQGLRGARQYSAHPRPGVARVAAFGDSFVYGSEVADSAAWSAIMERLFPQLEVLNYGVGGYGVDQAYLRFRAEGRALAPQLVIIGFTTDDLRRVVNVYRRFISNRELPLVKPRFTLDTLGRLVLLPEPLTHASDYARYLRAPRDIIELGTNDYWYQPAIYRDPLYDHSATVRLLTHLWLGIHRRYFAGDRLIRHGEFAPTSAAFQIQIALFEHFAAAVRSIGARPVVVIFPDRESVAEAREGRRTVLAPVIQAVAARGLEYIDLTRAFLDREAPGDVTGWFMSGGHYSLSGNRVVAEWLGREMVMRALSGPGHQVLRGGHATGIGGTPETAATAGSTTNSGPSSGAPPR